MSDAYKSILKIHKGEIERRNRRWINDANTVLYVKFSMIKNENPNISNYYKKITFRNLLLYQ